ncbi:ribulose-phosphate 3-epimerase [uncultured Alistipes sp.]|uniref:ribulose-phosphate 3-epimerase n=1 Tax=uncultured Alistipes sp. TaxID=538949 RepID=UPI00261E5DFF|nr:ribulose-phosphate 3-epimerase [uncultured Alistipes sp.]
MPRIISPSVLSADFGHLAEDIAMLDRSEAEWIHIDVMDGVFVPNISFGFPVMGPIRKGTKKVLDTHLMIVEPEKYIERFAKAGADVITIHLEATDDVRGAIAMMKKAGVKAGVSIKPATPVSAVVPYLDELDLVLIMSVEPGFGGQSFIEGSTQKVAELKAEIDRCGSRAVIEIDGGITLGNAAEVYAAGCEVLVAGSTVFASEDPERTIHELLNV